MEEYAREPCPWRIVDDCGGAFSMGAVGGTLFHGVKGFYNAPKGITRRLFGGLINVKREAPRLGGQFAIWGFTFSSIDCCMVALRGQEGPLNSITSGALTGALLTFRAGPSAMALSGFIGGFLLAAIEGVGLAMTWMTADQFKPVNPQMSDPSALPPVPEKSVHSSGSPTPTNPFGSPLNYT